MAELQTFQEPVLKEQLQQYSLEHLKLNHIVVSTYQFICKVCPKNPLANLQDAFDHIKTSGHARQARRNKKDFHTTQFNIAEKSDIPKKDLEFLRLKSVIPSDCRVFFCKVCQKNLSNIFTASDHIKLRTHKDLAKVNMSSFKLHWVYPTEGTRFVCKLCSKQLANAGAASKHIRKERHIAHTNMASHVNFLLSIPRPQPPHEEAIVNLIRKINCDHSLTTEEFRQRTAIADQIQTLLKPLGVRVEMYGSTATKTALKSSDLNLGFESDTEKPGPDLMQDILRKLQSCGDQFNSCTFQSNEKPKIQIVLKPGIVCNLVHIRNSSFLLKTVALKAYVEMDDRVRPLCVALQYLGSKIGFAIQTDGGMPSYGLVVMVIHFLQNCSPPVLPVLTLPYLANDRPPLKQMHAIMTKLQQQLSSWSSVNTSSIGALWMEMLLFYVSKFHFCNRDVSVRDLEPFRPDPSKTSIWAGGPIVIKDLINVNINIIKHLSHEKVTEFVLHCLTKSCEYFCVPQTKNGSMFNAVSTEAMSWFVSTQEKPAGKGGLKCRPHINSEAYPKHNPDGTPGLMNSDAACAAGEPVLLRSDARSGNSLGTAIDGGWGLEQQLNISVDDVDVKGDVGSTSYQVDVDSINYAGEDEDDTDSDCTDGFVSACSSDGDGVMESGSRPTVHEGVNDEDQSTRLAEIPLTRCEQTGVRSVDSVVPKMIGEQHCNKGLPHVIPQQKTQPRSRASKDTTQYYDESQVKNLTLEDHVFDFDTLKHRIKKAFPKICQMCHAHGHLEDRCVVYTLPPLVKLSPVTGKQRADIHNGLAYIFSSRKLSQFDLELRHSFIKLLEHQIQTTLPSAKVSLQLFGSSENGFGFKGSDMDICLFGDYPQLQHRKDDGVFMLKKVATVLRKSSTTKNVIPILHAKIPIVKFESVELGLEGDICFNNQLAFRNTKLLKAYASIDPRVELLGFGLKTLVKICDIGDASRGTLSSYAYTLMLIYFLQHTTPPVLPVLQELYEGNSRPKVMVEGWDTYFFEDVGRLQSVWPDHQKNTDGVSDLWIGLFRFYTEVFDVKHQAVCIRQTKPLQKTNKNWNESCLAIEDPFNLSRNLGKALQVKEFKSIMKILVNARNHFGTPTPVQFDHIKQCFDYFFDSNRLTHGADTKHQKHQPHLEPVASDASKRTCPVCKIQGHRPSNCPVKHKQKKSSKVKCDLCHKNGHSARSCRTKTKPQ